MLERVAQGRLGKDLQEETTVMPLLLMAVAAEAAQVLLEAQATLLPAAEPVGPEFQIR
jgi:hypothetical protein